MVHGHGVSLETEVFDRMDITVVRFERSKFPKLSKEAKGMFFFLLFWTLNLWEQKQAVS